MRSLTFIRFDLTLQSPGGVTTPAPLRKDGADAVVDTNAQGNFRLPGTSMAGMLRDRFRTEVSDERADRLFGFVHPATSDPRWPEDQGGDEQQSSALWVFDAVAQRSPDKPEIERTTTAIDRRRGAPLAHTLRTVQAAPPGTRFEARLMWEDAEGEDVEQMVRLVRSWEPRVGRGISAGAGRCTVSGVRVGTLDLTDPDHLTTWLTLSGAELADSVAVKDPTPATAGAPAPEARADGESGAVITVDFVTHGAVSVTSGKSGLQRATPLAEVDGKPYVPGTTLKGVVRSRMEYILRSVGIEECSTERTRCGNCLPCTFFGHAGRRTSAHSVGARGKVLIDDSVFSTLPGDHRVGVRERTHVAIDRFTGGSSRITATDAIVHASGEAGGRGRLFTVAGVERGGLRWRFDITALDEQGRADFRALLTLVCADVADGFLGLGRGSFGGSGTLRLAPGGSDQLDTIEGAQRRMRMIKEREVSQS